MSRKYLNRSEVQGCWARGHLCSRVAGRILSSSSRSVLFLFGSLPVGSISSCMAVLFYPSVSGSSSAHAPGMSGYSLLARCHRSPLIVLKVVAEASELRPGFVPASELHGRQGSRSASQGLDLWVSTVLGLWHWGRESAGSQAGLRKECQCSPLRSAAWKVTHCLPLDVVFKQRISTRAPWCPLSQSPKATLLAPVRCRGVT